ncbi:MAG: hypothetical protein K0R51_2898 [Cytophagaceae bacterium]|jgi:hypothetical protein|nr:hypothetical protein [Cytophagaceae bacterium]
MSRKVQAGALFVAVVIAFTIALLTTFLILMAYHFKLQARENIILKRLALNVNSSINLLLTRETPSSGSLEELDLYGLGEDSVSIKHEYWGVYEVATAKAFSGRYALTKTVQYGYQVHDSSRVAIYLSDLSRPLSICGTTLIKGNCRLPEKGIQTTYIEGKSYNGPNELLTGKVYRSQSTLPPLNKDMLTHLNKLFDKSYMLSSAYKVLENFEADTLIQSFIDSTIVIYMGSHASISNQYFSGNIIFYADESIEVDASAVLENTILVAPAIKIKRDFKGSLQAFATDSVIVEEKCSLNYPSVIGLFKKDHQVQQPHIRIKADALVQGVLFSTQSEEVTDMLQTLITVEKDATLQGQLYADGYADIKGKVLGSVYCNKFVLKTPSSVYENHLLDAVIDYPKLSSHYIGSGLISSAKQKGIIKWLE